MAHNSHITSFVKQYNTRSAQIEYLNKSPTSILTRLDPKFTSTLDSQVNPAYAYKSAMNGLYQDQLNKGLKEKVENMSHKREEFEENKKDYQNRVNGVLYQLEKNNLTYNILLQKKLNQQQQRKEKFIDESKLKGEKIDNFVDGHEDKNVFNHESDLYQQYQRSELQHSLSMLQLQKQSRIRENEVLKKEKQREYQQRMEFQRQLSWQRRQQRENRLQSQLKYQNQLQSLVYEKKQKNLMNNYSADFTNRKHNPITNPIEYHIQNPYILKKMAERQL